MRNGSTPAVRLRVWSQVREVVLQTATLEPPTRQAELAVRPSWGRRLVGIEGLRALAAISVLVHHVALRLADADAIGYAAKVAGWLTHGLTLFFVLSGFLLFRPFAASILEGRPLPSISSYARNRFLRIYPAYVVILLLVGLVFGAAYTEGRPTYGTAHIGYLTDPQVLAANVLMVQSYIPQTLLTGIGPAWSLGAEVAFYVTLPLLVLLSVRLARHGWRLGALLVGPAALAAVGWVTTLVLRDHTPNMGSHGASEYLWGHQWSAVAARSLLGQADLFAYGMFVAVLVAVLRRRGARVASWVSPALVLAAGALAWTALEGPLEPFARRFVGMAAALLLLAVILPTSSGEPSSVAKALEVRPLRYLGLVSYSVYLWHVPVLFWLSRHGLVFGRGAAGLVGNILAVAAVTLVLSWLTYRFVERPALRAKQPTEPRRTEERLLIGSG